jgi:hypothetical protein
VQPQMRHLPGSGFFKVELAYHAVCIGDPVKDDFVFQGECEGKYLAVLWNGMIDDSADRDREKVVISAALVAAKDQWQSLRSAWRKRLAQDGIEYFKSSHCRHLRGQFFKYRDHANFPAPSGRETADRMQEDLDKIINACDIRGVGAIIPVPLWQKFQSDTEYSAVCSGDPYHWAVQTVWMQCAQGVSELGRGNVIAFAHDDCSNFPVLYQLYGSYKTKNRTAKKLFVGLTALDDTTNPPIQAADVAASVTHRYAIEWLESRTTATLKRLRESMYRISVWDERFAHLVLDNELKKKRDRIPK